MNIIKVFIRKSCWTVNKVIPLPVSFFRYVLSYTNDKDMYQLRKENDVFASIYSSNFWESNESKSGEGSTLEATLAIREALPFIFKEYSIKSMLDVPCGDFNWMKYVDKTLLDQYYGGDVVPQICEKNNQLYISDKVKFFPIDITKDKLPQVDLIFCRDCLQHLAQENVIKALRNFKQSGGRYLLVTSYPKTYRNYDIYNGDYRALNLAKKPFNFPIPVLSVKETKNKGNEIDKVLNLYRISDIPETFS